MSRTVLIGLDGATFRVLDPLMEGGTMPFLRRFASEGVRAELLSTPLPLTAQAWPSLMTGRSPGNHGVFDFVRVEQGPEHPVYTLATSGDVRCETIWSMASRQEKTVLCLNFPLMFPPRPLNGYMVPGFVPWRHLRRAVYPPDIYHELTTLPGFDSKELALDYDMEKQAIQFLPKEEYERWIRFHIRRERQWFDLVRHFMVHHPCDLGAILFDGIDKLQHVCWPFLDPELVPSNPSDEERRIRGLCLDYFRSLDGYLEEIVALAGPDARVFMASDHGFGPSDQIFYANTWLEQAGYLAWNDGISADADGLLHAEGHKSTVVLFDWRRTMAFALTPSSNGIFIRSNGDGRHSSLRSEGYESFRRRLVDGFLAATDPSTGEAVVSSVLTREQAYPGSEMHRAPDLTLRLRDGGFISVLKANQPVRQRDRIVGTHRPEGVFLAGGSGVRQARLDRLSILDVAPTLLYSLGLPIPESLEGELRSELFEYPAAVTEPAPTETPVSPLESEALDPDDIPLESQVEILDRLRALGYVE